MIFVVDCGIGNLRSVVRALNQAAASMNRPPRIEVGNDPKRVLQANWIVLPGDGAFRACAGALRSRPGLVDALTRRVREQGVPFLGICVGMQLLLDASEEGIIECEERNCSADSASANRSIAHPSSASERGSDCPETDPEDLAAIDKGLGWLSGICRKIASHPGKYKVPHMGWNALEAHASHPVLAGIPLGEDGLHAYFLHSFRVELCDPGHCIASTFYGNPHAPNDSSASVRPQGAMRAIPAIIGQDSILGTQFHPEKSQRLGARLLTNFLAWNP